MRSLVFFSIAFLILGIALMSNQARPRLREFGIETGILKPGELNAITDVSGVLVGQVTIIEGKDIRTGVTAVLPHGDNLYQSKVPAAVYVWLGLWTVEVRRSGAQPVAGQRRDATLIYPGALGDGDVVLLATERLLEELLVLRTPIDELSYEFELPTRWTAQIAPGAPRVVELRDAAGDAQLRVRAARAWDGHGELVDLSLRHSKTSD